MISASALTAFVFSSLNSYASIAEHCAESMTVCVKTFWLNTDFLIIPVASGIDISFVVKAAAVRRKNILCSVAVFHHFFFLP